MRWQHEGLGKVAQRLVGPRVVLALHSTPPRLALHRGFTCSHFLFPGARGGGGWHKASVSDCVPLAAPIGLSELHILTLCLPERVLVVLEGGGGGEFSLKGQLGAELALGRLLPSTHQEKQTNNDATCLTVNIHEGVDVVVEHAGAQWVAVIRPQIEAAELALGRSRGYGQLALVVRLLPAGVPATVEHAQDTTAAEPTHTARHHQEPVEPLQGRGGGSGGHCPGGDAQSTCEQWWGCTGTVLLDGGARAEGHGRSTTAGRPTHTPHHMFRFSRGNAVWNARPLRIPAIR